MSGRQGERDSTTPAGQSDDLPEGWAIAKLGGGLVESIQPGFACGVNNRAGEGTAHLRPMNVSQAGQIELTDVKYVPAAKVNGDNRWVKTGDVLFNNTNSTELVGKTALYDLEEPRAFSNHMTRIRCRADVLNPPFCALGLHHAWQTGYFQTVCNQHVSQSSVSRNVLLETILPLPPLAEQKRIVAKVEALLARTNAARERLAKVPELLKRFRQSVLAAACSGQLTADWREENPDVESADVLVRRIAGFEGAANSPLDDVPVELPEIPDTWIWSSCQQLCQEDRGITYGVIKLGPPVEDGVPTLRSSDVRWLYIDGGRVKRISKKIAANYSRTFLQGGEVLVTVRGTLGGVAIVPEAFAGFNISREVAMIPFHSLLVGRYISYTIASLPSQNWLSEVARGVAYTGINIRDLKLLLIPVPPIDEQLEIVNRVEHLFSIADRIQDRIEIATKRSAAITQSVLARAFRGELVPQDPNDEPASVLLDHIRAEREAAAPPERRQRKTPKPKRTRRSRQANDAPGPGIESAPKDKPEADRAARARKPIKRPAQAHHALDGYSTDEIMAAFRQACRGAGEVTEPELLRAVAGRLGYGRLGKKIREDLEGHLRAAIRRQIVERDGEYLSCPTAIFRNYDTDFLIKMLRSVMRKGTEYERDEVVRLVAQYLGYSQISAAIRGQMKTIFNAAIRRKILGAKGQSIWRET